MICNGVIEMNTISVFCVCFGFRIELYNNIVSGHV
jgi:hypothetical protein